MMKYLKEGDIMGNINIRDIKYVTSRGFYAPLTASGTILVDNAPFSCYSDINAHHFLHYIVRYGMYYLNQVTTDNIDCAFERLKKFTHLIPTFLQ